MRMLTAVAVTIAAAFACGTAVAQEAATAAAPAPAAAAAAAEVHYSNKWRLEVSEGANNNGNMHFRVTPRDGTPVDVNVRLKNGRGEDGCARDIRDAFKSALDRKIYKIEIDDEEDVLVKKRRGPDFAVELVESTVKGTRVNLDRE